MGSCTYLFPGTGVIAAPITAGWLVWISTILPLWLAGRLQLSGAEFGDTAALPATALTFLLLRATHSTQPVTGWAAKRLSVCKRDRPGLVSLLTTGRRPIGSVSTTATPILVVSAPRWSMCPVLRLRNWCLPSARIRTPTCWTATISAVLVRLLLRRT